MAKVLEAPEIDEEEMQSVYNWVDEIPLSRPKRNIARDFSDGVLLAEIMKHFEPKLVELHNYPPAHSNQQKLYNWNTLNQKVFRKMGFQVSRQDIDRVVNCMPEAIEKVLRLVQLKITDYKNRTPQRSVTEETFQRRPSPRRDAGGYNPTMPSSYTGAESQALVEKEQIIHELKETIEIMELKIKKLEQLVLLKDGKIQTLTSKLTSAGLMP